MPSLIMLVFMALSANVCLATTVEPVTVAAVATVTEAPAATIQMLPTVAPVITGQDPFVEPAPEQANTIKPPADVVCPVMSPLSVGTYLQTDPWAFHHTIAVRQKAALFDEGQDAAVAEAPATNTAEGPTPAPTDRLIGTVISTLAFDVGRWGTEYGLYDPLHTKLIAKIDMSFLGQYSRTATQDIFNCQGAKIGSIEFDNSFRNPFADNTYRPHKVLDATGVHVATLAEDQTKPNNFFGEIQYFTYLKDLQGTPLASMRKPTGGWKVGPFFQNFDVAIEVLTENAVAPPPTMEPEFMSLVFATSLAMGQKFGPYWSLIFGCSVWFLIILCICLSVCFGSKEDIKDAQKKVDEESHALLGNDHGQQKVEDKAKSIWACCSRKVAPEKSNMDKARDLGHGAEASAKKAEASVASAAHGGH